MKSFLIYSIVLSLAPLPLASQQFVKTGYPVEQNGRDLSLAFAGGLDAPQFSQVDLNRDGIPDIFIFDRQGNAAIALIANIENGEVSYHLDWDVLEHLPRLHSWALFRDFNGDGIEDLFTSTAEIGVQGIDVHRGRDAGDKLRFEKMHFDHGPFDALYFKLPNGSFTPMYSAWIDIPAIVDVDGDGDLDILAFEPGGSYVHYFRNMALEHGLGLDTFFFEWSDHCWGKFFESDFSQTITLSTSPTQCATGGSTIQPRHSGSAIFAYDYNMNGLMDLFIGDLSSPRIILLTNTGTPAQAWMTAQDVSFPSYDVPVFIREFVAPFIIDVDLDGVDDFIATSNFDGFSENYNMVWHYRNFGQPGDPEFRLQRTDLFVGDMLDFGSESKPAIFDYNNDGLPDIVVGTGGYYTPGGDREARLILLKNVGTPESPAFRVEDDDFLGFSQYVSVPTWEFAPAAGDLDGDGDIDLLIGDRNGGLFFVENIAGPNAPAVFAAPVYSYMGINVGTSSTPVMIDLNGDGLMDIVVGERLGNNDAMGRCGNLNYYQNVGSVGNPQFIADVTQHPNTQCLGRVLFNPHAPLAEFSAPFFIRVDEGLRLITGSENGTVRMYGDIEGNIYGSFTPLDHDALSGVRDGGRIVPALADLTGNGYYDMVLGNRRGGLTIYTTDFRVSATGTKDLDRDIVSPPFLSPNLTSGTVRLMIPGGGQGSMRVFDSTGRHIESFENVGHGTELALIYPTGLYFVTISLDTEVFTQKVIVQR